MFPEPEPEPEPPILISFEERYGQYLKYNAGL